MTEFPAVLTAPETNTFIDHHGILISHVGEDGGMVALGHHDLKAAQAAFLAHDDVWGDDMPVRTTWAVLTEPTPVDGEILPWWMQWDVDEAAPGAFPVMVVEA